MRAYRLISGDSHIIEPPDLWTSRLPERFKSRAPHLASFEKGDAWVFEGARGPINFGGNVSGGLGPFKEQMNDRHKRYHPAERPKLELLPSGYLERNIFFTYITDSYGIKNWALVGAGQIMWSSDFAHSGTNWPNSWKVIEQDFAGVPPEVRQKILAGNLMRVYHI